MKFWKKKKGMKLFDIESRRITVPHGYSREIVTFRDEEDHTQEHK